MSANRDFTHHSVTCRLRRSNSRLEEPGVNEIRGTSHLRCGAPRLLQRGTTRTLDGISMAPAKLVNRIATVLFIGGFIAIIALRITPISWFP